VAEVCLTRDELAVTAAGQFSLPFPVQDEVIFAEEMADALASAVQNSGADTRYVVTAIPGEKVVTRHIRIPPVPPKEIERVLKWEAERYIPLPVSDLIIRHVNLGEVNSAHGPELHLLLAAVPETLVRECHRCFTEAGLRLVAVDLRSLALWRAFAGSSGDGLQDPSTWAVLNIDVSYSQLVVVREGRLQYTRSLPQGLQVAVEVDGKDGARGISDQSEGVIYRAALEELAREAQRSFSWYQAQDREHPITKIILNGVGSKIQNLGPYLANRLGIPVVMDGPPVQIKTQGDYDPAFALAIGLALWGVQ
jgi:type IV pilus assembly protein PilM